MRFFGATEKVAASWHGCWYELLSDPSLPRRCCFKPTHPGDGRAGLWVLVAPSIPSWVHWDPSLSLDNGRWHETASPLCMKHRQRATSVLEPLDNMQESFIRQLGLTRCQTFLDHNLAPLCVPRDIAMLGLIFRSVSGQTHADLAALFDPAPPTEHHHRTRRAANQHDRQLQEDRPGSHPALLQRSVLGLIRVWNRLPHHVVHCACVSAFQGSLTELAREIAAPKMRTGTCGCRHAASFCDCLSTFVRCQGFIRPVPHLQFALYLFSATRSCRIALAKRFRKKTKTQFLTPMRSQGT